MFLFSTIKEIFFPHRCARCGGATGDYRALYIVCELVDQHIVNAE